MRISKLEGIVADELVPFFRTAINGMTVGLDDETIQTKLTEDGCKSAKTVLVTAKFLTGQPA